jgi:8-oxo-dGTP diphosphatase
MTIYLVRHAKAGSRSDWAEDDWLRPLSRDGQAQARGLLEQFHSARFRRILSSPYVRCMETVVPLGAAHGVAIRPADALAEAARLEGALALLKEHVNHGAVFCSHGDVIPMLLEQLAADGLDLGADPRCEKGSTWVLTTKRGAIVSAEYVAPPT